MIIVKTIISESKIPEYSIRIQDFQKKICSLNTTVQELKSKKFSLKKIKDDLMLYVSILFKCLELKASRRHYWQGTNAKMEH